MRLSICQLLLIAWGTGLALAEPGNAQELMNRKVTLKAVNLPVRTILATLQKSASVQFMYTSAVINRNQRATLSVTNERLADVLASLLTPLNVNYRLVNDDVIVLNREQALLNGMTAPPVANEAPFADREVTGVITGSDDNQPMPGVSVLLKNTSRGTVTDNAGTFRLRIPEGPQTLVVSFIGYQSQEIQVAAGQTTLTAVLSTGNLSLNEVVVVGYGERKRTTYTGSVAAIDNKEIIRAPVADLSNNLVGRLPGVIATQRTGEPGADGSDILIRGISTTGSNAPLIVIDGIPRSDYGFSQIDPNEIENISILKDAAAASVFGVRGANGVILITTKRGKSGKPQFSLSTRMDIQQITRRPKYLDSYNMAVLYNEALRNEGKPELYNQAALDAYRNGTDPDAFPNTDWWAVTLNPTAPQSQHNLNVSGGGDKSRYFLSAGYLDQKGLYDNLRYRRYNFRSNIDVDVTPTTNVRLDLTGRLENRNFPGISAAGIFDVLTRRKPTFAAVYSNGLPGTSPTEAIENSGYTVGNRNVFQSLLSITQQLSFIPGLSVKGQVAYDRLFNTSKSWNTPYVTYDYDAAKKVFLPLNNGVSRLGQFFEQNQSLTSELHLNYTHSFDKHNVSGLLLYTQTAFTYDNLGGARLNFLSSAIDQLNVGGVSDQPLATGNADERARRGVVGRVTYDYDTRYLFEASFRYDGSENFPAAKRWGFFPSVSAGWRLSEEPFIKNALSFVDNLKIRGSVGQLGNDVLVGEGGGAQRFAYYGAYNFSDPYSFNGNLVQTLREGRLANQNITWEKATSANLGLEGSLFKNKLTFEIDYFYKLTTDILGRRQLAIPAQAGITQLPFENLDKVSNRGVEVVLGHNNQVGAVRYYVRGNFTYAKNRVEYRAEPADINPNIQQTGRSIGQYFGLQAVGLFQNQAEIDGSAKQNGTIRPGDIRYADINGDKVIDDKDRVAIGFSPIPQLIYGLTLGANWKGFDVNVLVQGAGNVSAYVSQELSWAFFNGGKATEEHLNRWTPDNPGATYPRITTDLSGNNALFSSYWLRDASYVRLKNVEVGYNLPTGLLNRISIKSARIFVLGQNLVTIDQLKVADPEGPGASGNAGRGWFYPQQKTYSLGLNINF